MRRDQRAGRRRDRRNRCSGTGIEGFEFSEIRRGIRSVRGRVLRVMLRQGVDCRLQGLCPQCRVHPDMGVMGFAVPGQQVSALERIGNADHRFARCEPVQHIDHLRFEMQAVIEDDICAVDLGDIRPGKTVEMRIDAVAHQGDDIRLAGGDLHQRLADLRDGGDDIFAGMRGQGGQCRQQDYPGACAYPSDPETGPHPSHR